MRFFSGFIRRIELAGVLIASVILLVAGALIDSDPIPENKWSMVTDVMIMLPILFCLVFFIYFSGKLVYSCLAEIVDWIKRD